MLLSDLKKGECAKIVSVESDSILKSRFNSFGIVKGSTISILEQTLSKNTIEVKIQNSKIAIRISEAQTIKVEKIEC